MEKRKLIKLLVWKICDFSTALDNLPSYDPDFVQTKIAAMHKRSLMLLIYAELLLCTDVSKF